MALNLTLSQEQKNDNPGKAFICGHLERLH